MHNWFECKISYEKIQENGMEKKVTEPYLVDALSWTEAEARIIEEMRPFISGEFTITDIKRAKISEIFYNENGDRYFQAKIGFITLDEHSGAEKLTYSKMIAQACTFREALSVIEEGMKDSMADYVIKSISETELIDIYPFSANTGKDLFSDMAIPVEYNPEGGKDEYFDKAVNLVIMNNGATIAMLQRNFGIGYNRASSLMGQLEDAKVVGPFTGEPACYLNSCIII